MPTKRGPLWSGRFSRWAKSIARASFQDGPLASLRGTAQRAVTVLTALSITLGYIDLSWMDLAMPASEWQLNRVERILFRTAIALAILILAVRVGAMAALWFLHQ